MEKSKKQRTHIFRLSDALCSVGCITTVFAFYALFFSGVAALLRWSAQIVAVGEVGVPTKVVLIITSGIGGAVSGAIGLTLLGFIIWMLSDFWARYRNPDFSTDGQTAMFVFVTLQGGVIIGFLIGAGFVFIRLLH